MKIHTLIGAIVLLATVPVHAQQQDVKLLAPGETVINLSATEQVAVVQDLLQASLRIEIDGEDPKDVQNRINKAMAEIADLSKSYKDIKTSTGQYYVYSFDPNPQPPQQNLREAQARVKWKGNQTIEISSKDSAKILELAGKIQEKGFVMNGLNYILSPELQEKYKDDLMVDALKKVQKKADVAAKALGKSNASLVEVTVDNSGPIMPQPVMFKAAHDKGMSADRMSSPVAVAGEQMVSLTVTARVLLKP